MTLVKKIKDKKVNFEFNKEYINVLTDKISSNDNEFISKSFKEMHPADAADIIEHLNESDREKLVKINDFKVEPEVFVELNESIQAEIIRHLSTDSVVFILKNLEFFKMLELPILVGLSRKSMIYKKLKISPGKALNGTSILNSIAVNLAHPWVEEEHDVDEADVAYRMYETWEILPRKGRVVKNLEENGLLIDGKDNEVSFQISKPLFGASILDANNEKMELEVIKWLNLALALRDAQNDIEDEIESARIREEDDGIDIERIWPKTNPGDLNVKPGAIFRKLSKSKK